MAKPCSARMVMPWLETVPVEERIRFIGDALSDRFTMSELCARYGVSRRVGYKWLARYEEEGRRGLRDRSRAPRHCPHLLARRGLVLKRRRRRPHQHPGVIAPTTEAPNDLWTADFKGEFKPGNGSYCYPLTIADQHTRFLLACHGLLSTQTVTARPVSGFNTSASFPDDRIRTERTSECTAP